MKVALFDLDGTIFRGFSTHVYADFLTSRNLMHKKSAKKIKELFASYYRKEIPYRKMVGDLAIFWGEGLKGFKKKEVKKAAFEYDVKKHLYGFTPPFMKLLKENGFKTILITGANEEIVEPVIKATGIEEHYSTTFKVKNGIYTGEVEFLCTMPEVKQKMVDEIEKEYGLEGAVGGGDTDHDIPILERVKFPIAIFPNEALERAAKERNWLIIKDESVESLERIKKYIGIA